MSQITIIIRIFEGSLFVQGLNKSYCLEKSLLAQESWVRLLTQSEVDTKVLTSFDLAQARLTSTDSDATKAKAK